ncbi:MAG: agmatinase [Desulfobacterota bacterium]|nr:agmatinase [Thermodesulfobacteriota bacterium]MDW8001532.1 agmatinase [Deltaproteobacteria bacterium]
MGLETPDNAKYMGAQNDYEGSEIVLVGCPLDITSSFRGGTRFAPETIRRASWTLETYSPYLRRDLREVKLSDVGNMPLIPSDLKESLKLIERRTLELLQDSKKTIFLGGEHLITYPIVKALKQHVNGLQIIHFDAHWDLRNSYEGMELCHATVMKRIKELGIEKVFHIGVRSGTEEEFKLGKLVRSPNLLKEEIDFRTPTYITFDMDVLDPSLVPGVTTPEPGGLFFHDIMEYLQSMSGMDIVGADLVELAPDYDPTFVSSICAAKVVRELILLMA